jgi:NAD-dependent deacetylase
MKKIVVLTGAGISAESGIATFRGSNGLWEGHDVTQVASPEGWKRDPATVLRFYNERRDAVRKAQPNPGHKALVDLEQKYDVQIVTQNIDDLHERAGSSKVLHLHGEILLAQSTQNPELVYHLGNHNIQIGDVCEEGSQLRPYIVWFGEDVPLFANAIVEAMEADIFIVVGTSLLVYPAASLLGYAPKNAALYLVDPERPKASLPAGLTFIGEPASTGMVKLAEQLLAEA